METQIERAKPQRISETYFFYFQFPFAAILAYICMYIINLPWITIFVVYGFIPWLDGIVSKDQDNPSREEAEEIEDDWRFKLSLYLAIIVDWISVFNGVAAISRGEKGYIDIIPMLFLLVNIGATGFVVAHELFHRLDRVDRFVGTIHMLKNLYLHLTIQHIYGHHKRVATPQDGATAERGMSVYQFFPRAVYRIYCSAYNINPWFVRISTVSYFLICFVVYRVFGLAGLGFFLLVALGSVFYLQTTSYIQHYGLLRKKLPNGEYQPVNRKCSWDSNNRISNYLLYKLQRHSDHHENSLKPYQNLCCNEDAPQLPHGYIVCILMAFFPSVWFQTMNPLLDEYNKGSDGDPQAALKRAQQKANQFVHRSMLVSGSFMIGEMVSKLLL